MKDQVNRGRWLSLVALFVLLSLHMVLAVSWLANDSTPLMWDSAEHAGKVVKVQHVLYRTSPPLKGRLLNESLHDLALAHPTWARVLALPLAGPANWIESHYLGSARPPGSYLSSGLLLGPSEASPDRIALAQGIVWFLALICATYLLGLELYGAWGAILSGLLVSGYPIFFGQAHLPMLDIPLATASSFGIWALLRSHGFRNIRGSLIAGASLGLGMLIKQPYFALLALPIAWHLVDILRKRKIDPSAARPRLTHLAFAAFASLLVAGPWYIANSFSTLRFMVRSAMSGAVEGDPSSFSIAGLLFYPQSMLEHSMGPWFFGLALLGLFNLLRPGTQRERVHLGLGILSVMLTFILLHPNKDSRYIAPALPLLAVASAGALLRIRSVPWRTATTTAVVLLVGSTALTTSHFTDSSGASSKEPQNKLFQLFSVRSSLAFPPRQEDWRVDEVLLAVEAHRGRGRPNIRFLVSETQARFTHGLSIQQLRERLRARDGLPALHLEITKGTPSQTDSDFYLLVIHDGPQNAVPADTRAGRRNEMEELMVLDSLPEGKTGRLFFHSARRKTP